MKKKEKREELYAFLLPATNELSSSMKKKSLVLETANEVALFRVNLRRLNLDAKKFYQIKRKKAVQALQGENKSISHGTCIGTL